MEEKSDVRARKALYSFKSEVAGELGMNPQYKMGYWGNVSSREYGPQGGYLMRGVIAAAERELLTKENFGKTFSSP